MTVLLSGATGFLGSYLLKKLLQEGFEVVALKRKQSDSCRIINELGEATFYDTDMIDLADVFRSHTIDLVINTVTDYGRSDNQISSILATNLLFGVRLLELSVENRIKTFINTDTLLERTLNPYALSKAQLVDWMRFLSTPETKMVNIKIEHMYGPMDDSTKFIAWIIEQLKANVKSIDLTSGVQKRDFIYIDDVVDAYMTIIAHLNTLSPFEEFELGSAHPIEVKDFLHLVYQEISQIHTLSSQLNFGAVPYRANEKMCLSADISKLQNLGWKPNVSLQDGIKNTIKGSFL